MLKFLNRSTNTILTLQGTITTTKTQFPSQKFFSKNDNLIYEDHQYRLLTYFFLPEIRKVNLSFAQINRDSNALSFVLTKKQKKKVEEQKGEEKKFVQEQKILSFSMKYQELAGLLEVTPDSNGKASIQKVKKGTQNNFVKTLNIEDNPSKKCVEFNFQQKLQQNDFNPRKSTFQFAYPKYRVFQILLQSSLFQLSGSGILYQLRQKQQLASSRDNLVLAQAYFQKQTKEFHN